MSHELFVSIKMVEMWACCTIVHKGSFALKFLNGLNKDPKYANFVMTAKTNWSQLGKTPDFLELVKQIKF
jgi:hypothetical protein